MLPANKHSYCACVRRCCSTRAGSSTRRSTSGSVGVQAKLHELTGGWTVPQILIDDRVIGGYTELWRLDRDGGLDELLAA